MQRRRVRKKAKDLAPGDKIDLEEWFSENYDEDDLDYEMDHEASDQWSEEAQLLLSIREDYTPVDKVMTLGSATLIETELVSLTVMSDRLFALGRTYREDEEIH